MKTLNRILCGSALTASVLFAGIKAEAQAITPTLTGTTFSAGITTFNYTILLGADSTATAANPTSGLTFFDFFGLTGMPVFTPSATGANFTITTPATGTQAPNTIIGQSDSPTALNIDLRYTGTEIANASLNDTIILGTLTAQSTGTNQGLFTGFSSISQKTSNNSTAANQSFVAGPNLSGNSVPEPGAVAMLGGMSLMGSVFLRRRNRK